VSKMPGASNKGVASMVGTGKKRARILFNVRKMGLFVSSLNCHKRHKGSGSSHECFLMERCSAFGECVFRGVL
jgi:hypothetical protein